MAGPLGVSVQRAASPALRGSSAASPARAAWRWPSRPVGTRSSHSSTGAPSPVNRNAGVRVGGAANKVSGEFKGAALASTGWPDCPSRPGRPGWFRLSAPGSAAPTRRVPRRGCRTGSWCVDRH
ncbi:hypothetical protein G6F50_015785 [Rhizopus delemar]|uniref:Uncharacterized protein n=1 Tax=Rhizopus delemar TaxID=936053 RepID=A0A9P6XVX2_9FUNG|nr:hypothetical protein G6F50_015785 [Rhizopus delemar]